jgi:hypothetical protein
MLRNFSSGRVFLQEALVWLCAKSGRPLIFLSCYLNLWLRPARTGTFAFALALKAAPLKHQYPAIDPPAKTDHKIVFVHEA